MQIRVIVILENTTLGFKAFPGTEYKDNVLDPITLTDWSGIYPQTTYRNALAYLPNQFERGYSIAHISKMIVKKPLRMLIYNDIKFTDPILDSTEKAHLLRQAYQHYASTGLDLLQLDPTRPLVDAFGELEMILCVLDAEGFEFIIPHQLLNGDLFEFEPLHVFHQSTKILGLIGSIEGISIPKHILENTEALANHLSKEIPDDERTVLDLIY